MPNINGTGSPETFPYSPHDHRASTIILAETVDPRGARFALRLNAHRPGLRRCGLVMLAAHLRAFGAHCAIGINPGMISYSQSLMFVLDDGFTHDSRRRRTAVPLRRSSSSKDLDQTARRQTENVLSAHSGDDAFNPPQTAGVPGFIPKPAIPAQRPDNRCALALGL